jgi:signal transduction histidine kinase
VISDKTKTFFLITYHLSLITYLMIEQKHTSEESREDGEVVYRRISADGGEASKQDGRSGKRRKTPSAASLSPTLKTVIVGFVMLLALVALLGFLSVRKTDEVSAQILDEERRHASIRDFTLQLRLAATRLDNEARARGRKLGAESEETRPLFDRPLILAREDLQELHAKLNLPPYSESEKWRSLKERLALFVQATQDPDAYLREGYTRFRDADKELDALLDQTRREQDEILYRSEELQRQAARRIYLLTAIALLIGALVAAYTVWEMQRRFRQVRAGMEEVRREREFSTQMLEGMVSAVAAIDAHDRIRSANGAFFKIFPNARIGATLYDEKFASPDARKMLEAATSARIERSTYRGRWLCDEQTPNCADRTFDIYSSPLTIDGENGQIITLVDVTDAAEAETVLRRTEALTAMGQAVAQVAHEIKNPLGSIRLGVSMLRDTSTDAESLSTIDLVERGINHLNKLVVDVTQFSRQRPLELADVNLHELLDSSLELIADVIQEKQTPIEKHFSDKPLRGLWDADQLRQVFVNLLANAVDAGPERSPVTIRTEHIKGALETGGDAADNRSTGTANTFARVHVEDRGVGLDERTRARIFEPFFTTKKRGTGLGLAIVKQIVEQHGGAISVESSPGKGTRFIVDLPLRA